MAELRTFVFTDISGSVRLKDEMVGRSVTERDQAFIQSILSPHRQRIEAQLEDFGGRVVSTAGDGHFLVFDNTIQAAQWAVAVQEAHRDDPILAPNGSVVDVRISMHVGVPQSDPNDTDNFVGKSVDYASRLNDYATGGQILVSRSVMAILDDVGLEGMRLHDHGRKMLKGIGNVEVHELLYDERGPRPMRNQPKSHSERQWTVVPTMGFGGGPHEGNVTTLGGPAQEGRQLRAGGANRLRRHGRRVPHRHSQFGGVRAVKVIKRHFVSEGHTEVISRFYNEIKAAGRLEHKNIVVAIDSSSPTDKVHYLVMEYIEGVSLEDLVGRHGPLPVAESCEIIRQAARGLQYIHKNDMVHRDVKPSNLMVTLVEGEPQQGDSTLSAEAEGDRAVVKILDLGLALLAGDANDRLTRFDHKAMGTGMYMPPEQWRTTSVDIRADIYSLGCTLYHLLAGNPPFIDSDLRPEKAHEKAPVPPITSAMHPLPKKLLDVLRKMLEKRPEDRYATPAEVSAALAPFAEGHNLAGLVRSHMTGTTVTTALTPTKPNGASRVDTWRSRTWHSTAGLLRNRQAVLSKLVPLLLIAVFLGGAWWLLMKSRQQRLAHAEAQARSNLPSFARTAATLTLPKELELRFKTLVKEAADEKLRTLLKELSALPKDQQYNDESLKSIEMWLAERYNDYGESLGQGSWFIQDAQGVQIARSPKEAKSLKQNYRYRDYFHGQGGDVTPEEAEKLQAIRAPHLSTVYPSTSTNLLKVAFSVPVWDRLMPASDELEGSGTAAPAKDTAEAHVLGVLAMTMNVRDFTVLDKALAGGDTASGSEVVLIDLRDDWVEGKKQRGLILHHPRMDQKVAGHVSPELLKWIDEGQPLTDPEFKSADHFKSGYLNPLPSKEEIQNGEPVTYWGAYEPVSYGVNQAESSGRLRDRFGWVVLVQNPVVK